MDALVIGVSVIPGLTALIRMPLGASSIARVGIIDSIAPCDPAATALPVRARVDPIQVVPHAMNAP